MTQNNTAPCHLLATGSLVLAIVVFPMHGLADEPDQLLSDPGFRPESDYATAFLDAAETATIAVLPTLVRRIDRTAYSFESQERIVTFLNESGLTTAVTKPRRIDLGALQRRSQWEIFQYGSESISDNLGSYETGTDYALVMEILVPGNQAVFGIEIYIIDRQGRSAFSFLLNSHHQMFSNAKLVAKNASEESRNTMLEDATNVGLAALMAQFEQMQEGLSLKKP